MTDRAVNHYRGPAGQTDCGLQISDCGSAFGRGRKEGSRNRNQERRSADVACRKHRVRLENSKGHGFKWVAVSLPSRRLWRRGVGW